MTSVTVNINSIDKVKRFVSAITSFDNDFDLVCDRYVIDASLSWVSSVWIFPRT